MSRNWYLACAIVGMPATALFAARHELGWTVLGAISVGCNIYNYVRDEKKKGE